MNEFTKEELEIMDLSDLMAIPDKINRLAMMIEIIDERQGGYLREQINAIKFPEKCQHKSDGLIYTSNPPQNKCKKCGEFYR